MAINVGISGFGRMGKAVVKRMLQVGDGTRVGISRERLSGIKVRRCCLDHDLYRVLNALIGDNYDSDDIFVDSASKLYERSDIVVDFSSAEGLIECLEAARECGRPLISGTTAVESIDLRSYAEDIRILWSSNMSLAVNLMMCHVERLSKALKDFNYDIEVCETHHKLKKDAPSGTAISLGKAAARGAGVDFSITQYSGLCGVREHGSIGFSVSRGGGVVGDHTVMFLGSSDRLEITHKSMNRDIYADGALVAVRWMHDVCRYPGLYSMLDVLGFGKEHND